MRVFNRVTSEIATGRIIEADSYEYDGPAELCRGENEKAWNKSQIAKSNAGLTAAQGYGAQATGENPAAQFQAIANNPMSAEEKAGRLSAVGGAYDSMGQKAGERVAATRNSAGYGEMMDELARGKARTMGTTTAEMGGEEFQRRMAALGGKASIYGTDVGAQTNLLRPGEPVKQPGFWDQFIMTAMGNAQKAATMGMG